MADERELEQELRELENREKHFYEAGVEKLFSELKQQKINNRHLHRQLNAALAREAWLRLVVEEQREAVWEARRDLDHDSALLLTVTKARLEEIGKCLDDALADAPKNPYLALAEAARRLAVALHQHNERPDEHCETCDICCEVSDLLYDLGRALAAVGIDDLAKLPDIRDLAQRSVPPCPTS